MLSKETILEVNTLINFLLMLSSYLILILEYTLIFISFLNISQILSWYYAIVVFFNESS